MERPPIPLRSSRPSPPRWLRLQRTVRFGDTDAAGVMHFHQLLRWCHEAYEESLERYGIAATTIFPTPGHMPPIALPIVHCGADFLRPVVCGDRLSIALAPERLDPGCFEVRYAFAIAPAQSSATGSSANPSSAAQSSAARSSAARSSAEAGDAPGEAGGRPIARGWTRHRAIETASRRRCDLPDALNRWLEASALAQGVRPV